MVGTSNLGSWHGHWFSWAVSVAISYLNHLKPSNSSVTNVFTGHVPTCHPGASSPRETGSPAVLQLRWFLWLWNSASLQAQWVGIWGLRQDSWGPKSHPSHPSHPDPRDCGPVRCCEGYLILWPFYPCTAVVCKSGRNAIYPLVNELT